MEFLILRKVTVLQAPLLHIAFIVFFSCARFNEPVLPEVEFTREAYDKLAGIGVSFGYNSEHFTIDLQNNKGNFNSPFAKLFIRCRNGADLPESLSDSSVDYLVNFASSASTLLPENVEIVTWIIDRHGDTLRHKIRSVLNADNTYIARLDSLPDDVSLFYWQIEFYFEKGGTLRLPQTPCIWYFGLTKPGYFVY